VHTGQHHDELMSDAFFRDLELPEPTAFLRVGSGSQVHQLAAIAQALEAVLQDIRPDLVLVVGDVTSTLAASLTAVKLGFPVAHVEAGLRSFDRDMPEEINRIVTDAVADFLFATEASAVRNLLREGAPRERIFLVGNVMIDTLFMHMESIDRSAVVERLELEPAKYAVVTLHRPANVDEPEVLRQIAQALEELQDHIRLVFPVHPRTAARLDQFGVFGGGRRGTNLLRVEPLGYVDFMKLVKESAFVMTDSGGVQEESTALGIPCLTLRDSTERPVTVTEGTNRLVGTRRERIVEQALAILAGEKIEGRMPEHWDGAAAKRIVSVLVENQDRIRELHAPVRGRSLWLETFTRA
jgi:UDP-N-acetylglucosamine 2-epimerase (non-hydrolysing)